MFKNKKYLIAIDAILIFGSLVSIAFIIGYSQPNVIAPIENESLLILLPKSDFVLIDDNSKFESPDTVFINDAISLGSGRYFIKLFDGIKSDVRQIDLETNVDLEFRILGNNIAIYNLGDRKLEVDTYSKGTLISSSNSLNGGKK